MRARIFVSGVLALLGCLVVGAATGVWLYTLVGGHLYVVPRAVLVASGALGAVAVVFSLVAAVRRATSPGA